MTNPGKRPAWTYRAASIPSPDGAPQATAGRYYTTVPFR